MMIRIQNLFMKGFFDNITDDSIHYNGSAHYIPSNPVLDNTKIKFEFIGSKLRIISSTFEDYSDSLVVNIDGVEHILS